MADFKDYLMPKTEAKGVSNIRYVMLEDFIMSWKMKMLVLC
jgi:hypothetical protein